MASSTKKYLDYLGLTEYHNKLSSILSSLGNEIEDIKDNESANIIKEVNNILYGQDTAPQGADPVTTENLAETLGDYALKTDIKNATLNIKRNNTSVGTFTANSNTNTDINISVPTSISDLGAEAVTEIQNIIKYGQTDVSELSNAQKEAAEEAAALASGYLKAEDIADFFDSVEYDSNNHRINFKNGNSVKAYVDATPFIKDGMIENVSISNGNLVIDFNTDSGITDINIPITDIFNSNDYYTKTLIDNLVNYGTLTPGDNPVSDPTVHTSDLADVATSGDYNDLINKPTLADALIQSNWNETNTSSKAFILNKPIVYTLSEILNIILYGQADVSGMTSEEKEEAEASTKASLNIPTKTSDLTNDSGFLTSHQDISGKQDIINDLATIRNGAAAGATALQSETDPIFTASPAYGITTNDITNWNSKTNNVGTVTGVKIGEGGSTISPTNGIITIPESDSNVQADWEEDDSTDDAYIKNKPIALVNNEILALFNGNIDPTTSSVVLTTQNADSKLSSLGFLKSTSLADVATSGDYNDLINIPTNISSFTNDAGYITSHQDVTGKANSADLSTVATSGLYSDLIGTPASLPASDVSAWAKAANKPNYTYSEIGYTTNSASGSGAVSIDPTIPLHEITASAAISGITFTSATIPENGHSVHIIVKATSALTVSIAHGATMATINGTNYVSVCPEAKALDLSITANGYVEIDMLRIGTNIYVRGV